MLDRTKTIGKRAAIASLWLITEAKKEAMRELRRLTMLENSIKERMNEVITELDETDTEKAG